MYNYCILFIIVILFNYFIGSIAYVSNYYDIDAIKKETSWKDVSVQELKKVNHLSFISQSPYYYKDSKFDPNYYYPSSAGQGIDIYIIDESVDFNHEDFEISNRFYNGRTITCDAIANSTDIHETSEDQKKKCKYAEGANLHHGTMASSVAAGNISGVAKKANIHFIASENSSKAHKNSVDFIIKKTKKKKEAGTTIVSISSAGNRYNSEDSKFLEELTKNGIIVIVSADNENRNCCLNKEEVENLNFVSYPGYGIAITVGAVNSTISNDGYRKANYSNYGKCVDIFAPGNVLVADPSTGKNAYKETGGTSSSTPVVAGIAALLLAENTEKPKNGITYQEFMRNKLIEMSIQNAITDLNYVGSQDTPNYFVNNGKKSIYSPMDINIECGISSDGKEHGFCAAGCCSKEGKCVKFQNNPWDVCLIENGCQNEYGRCYTKENSVSECEKLLKDNERCLVDPSKNKNTCEDFNLPYCQKFYKLLYANQTACSIAKNDKSNKNRVSLEYIFTFNKEKYNEYADICNDDLEYHEKKCKKALGECYVKDIIDKFTKSLSDNYDIDQRLRYNKCENIYSNIDEIINQTPSCARIIEKKSKDYLTDNVLQIEIHQNYMYNYLYSKYKLFDKCFIDDTKNNEIYKITEDINCNALYTDYFFDKYIPRNEYYLSNLDEKSKKLVNKMINNKNYYFSKTRKKVTINNA
eukprot:jgi/Orpsp1_1/1182831/evm.model.c7180000082832.1